MKYSPECACLTVLRSIERRINVEIMQNRSLTHRNYVRYVVVPGRYRLTLNQQFLNVFKQIRPRSLNTKNNYKAVLKDIRDILRKEFHLKKLANLKTKHFDRIIEIWKERGYAPGTLAGRMSILRRFAEATGKVSCVKRNKEYGISRGKQVFGEKRWTPGGISDRDIIKGVDDSVHKYGQRIRHVLYMQRVFGLRRREALMFNPVEQIVLDKSGKPIRIDVIRGSKNARRREVPVVMNEQRNLLNYLIRTYEETAIQPERMDYKKWRNIYCYVMKKLGISGDIKGHGLRQGYANDRYNYLMSKVKNDYLKKHGYIRESKIKGIVYKILTEELGHSRIDILRNYLENY